MASESNERSRLVPYLVPQDTGGGRSNSVPMNGYQHQLLPPMHSHLHQEKTSDIIIDKSQYNYSARDAAKALAFGAFEGLLMALTVVSGAAGAALTFETTLVLTFSVVVASSFAVAGNEYLSSKAHKQYLEVARRREMWEFKHFRDAEIAQMTNRFVARGMARKDAESIVFKIADYDKVFVSIMVAEELGYHVPTPAEDDGSGYRSFIDAALTFIAFFVLGLIPAALIWFGRACLLSMETTFYVAIGCSIFFLFCISMLKTYFSSATLLHVILESVVLGCLCAVSSLTVASLFADLLNII